MNQALVVKPSSYARSFLAFREDVERNKGRVRDVLSRKGFRLDNASHKKYWLYVDGVKQSIFTFFSHGGGNTLNDSLIRQIAIQLHISKQQLDLLTNCTWSGVDYVDHLRRNNFDLQPNVGMVAEPPPPRHPAKRKRRR